MSSGEFQVHTYAAGKSRKRKQSAKSGEVSVTRVDRAALALAKKLVKGKDMHIEVRPDGTIDIVNGGR